MSRRQKRKSIRTLLMLGVSGSALASLVATLVYAYSPRLANWQLSPQEIAEANDPSAPSPKNGWTSRLVPPLPSGEGSGPDLTIPTNSEIQVAGLAPSDDSTTTGTDEGGPATGGAGGTGSIGGTFEQTYGNGPQFGGMGGQGGTPGFGAPNGTGGSNPQPMSFGAPSLPSSGPGNPPSDPPPEKSADGPDTDDPQAPPKNPECTVNCEFVYVPPSNENPPGNPQPGNPPPGNPPPGYTPPGQPGPPTPSGPSDPPPVGGNPPPPPALAAEDPPITDTNNCVANCSSITQPNDLVAIPEPGALALFLMGLAGIGLTLRRRA
jgi:hypothetical protein